MLQTTVTQLGGQVVGMSPEITPGQRLFALALIVLLFVLISYFHHWIWNNLLVKYVSVLKPIPTLWEFILVSYLIMALFKSI